MRQFTVHCKQIVETPSDWNDRQDLNLGHNKEITRDYTAASKDDALEQFHNEQPVACLEEYEIWAE